MPELQDIRNGVRFFKEVVEWFQSLIDKDKRQCFNAIKAIHKAATATNFYLGEIRDKKPANKEKERELSMLWEEAMYAVQPVNPALAEKCLIKGQCWSDSRLFNSKAYEDVPLSIDYIFTETRNMLKKMS